MRFRLVLMYLFLVGLPSHAWSLSPLNLNPGYPTKLDDAYPVPNGELVGQSGLTGDKYHPSAIRLRNTVDLRYGATDDLELDAGITPLRGPLTPGTPDDPRAIRLGFLSRLGRQNEAVPSVAIRTTLQIPYIHANAGPSARVTGIASWKLTPEWYFHTNAGVEIGGDQELGHFNGGRKSQKFGNIGTVFQPTSHSVVILNMGFQEDPLQKTNRWIVTPELGLIIPLSPTFHMMGSLANDMGAQSQNNNLKTLIGLTYVW